ncbi:MAG: DNA-binding response regulator MtrA [Candidatus Aerophobetes bacterium ADurb.Bin490]|nr:MAG: DNA-binding response regulator MtrA [Candidatus Aerophobetes bacterium ADurb.Bin490]HPI04002.1 response regulator [Candidatus Goldiibacteriota bacterium]HPN63920.1 response regulator [Candidatus Goldiibacteriota bacterium]HRQ44758.1 response regulator [Candidatus Goldiibacteriota bacterium]
MNNKLIFIVDDEPAICRLMRILLEDTGYDIKEFHNGAELMEELLHSALPELVLLDIMLPGMNGYDICRFIKNDPALKQIKVLLFSALSENEMKGKAETSGADAYFSKNIELEYLREKIVTAINPQL